MAKALPAYYNQSNIAEEDLELHLAFLVTCLVDLANMLQAANANKGAKIYGGYMDTLE